MQSNILLKNHSNYKIGGPAKFFIDILKKEDLNISFEQFNRIFILGGGTNVLFDDLGFDGLVIKNSIKKIQKVEENGEVFLTVGTGEQIFDILNFCTENSFSGLEWAGGLPGTIGGAVRGNAGAFGGEIKDSVFEVESIDLKSGKKFTRSNKECEFGYRTSIFKKNPDELITFVTLKLSPGDKEEIEKLTNEKIDYRNLKHPMNFPNIGSTFKNIPLSIIGENLKKEFSSFIKNDPFPIVPTAKLLALAGLKGRKVGDAQISEKHPNFIVNLGNAKASDVLKLIEIAKEKIREKWGIELEEEILYLKF